MRSMSTRFLVFAAVVAVAAALGGCNSRGAKPPPGVKAVGNRVCPVSGKPVGGSAKAPTFHSDFRGRRIGFMCPVCKSEFDGASPARKLELLNKALKSVGEKPLPPPRS